MWKIDRPIEHRRASKYFHRRWEVSLTFYFLIKDHDGRNVAHGRSSVRMDPEPLWQCGFSFGGKTIWYLNTETFNYERFTPHRERTL